MAIRTVTVAAGAPGQVEVVMTATRLMRGHSLAQAMFGSFACSGNTVEYTAALWYDEDGALLHNWENEFADDLDVLRDGSVEWLD